MKTLTAATLLATAGVFGLSGCASTGNITPQYVPPSTYQSYDCQALSQEYNRVNRYVDAARNEQSTLSASGVALGFPLDAGVFPLISALVLVKATILKRAMPSYQDCMASVMPSFSLPVSSVVALPMVLRFMVSNA